jgi:hypothetical protein
MFGSALDGGRHRQSESRVHLDSVNFSPITNTIDVNLAGITPLAEVASFRVAE